jgi:hypothetical protein
MMKEFDEAQSTNEYLTGELIRGASSKRDHDRKQSQIRTAVK